MKLLNYARYKANEITDAEINLITTSIELHIKNIKQGIHKLILRNNIKSTCSESKT